MTNNKGTSIDSYGTPLSAVRKTPFYNQPLSSVTRSILDQIYQLTMFHVRLNRLGQQNMKDDFHCPNHKFDQLSLGSDEDDQ